MRVAVPNTSPATSRLERPSSGGSGANRPPPSFLHGFAEVKGTLRKLVGNGQYEYSLRQS